MLLGGHIRDGHFTRVVYEWLRDETYEPAIAVLLEALQERPKCRAFLSLLAYCYYAREQYDEATQRYAQLMHICPGNLDYRINYAQCLFKAGGADDDEVFRVLGSLKEETAAAGQLRLAVAYETNDIKMYRGLLEQLTEETTVQTLVNQGSLLYKVGRYGEARKKYMEAIETVGFEAFYAYGCAICSYELREFGPALQYIAAIVEQSNIITAPMSNNSDKDSFLIEALNLKFAIEMELKNREAAQEVLQSMPPRDESDVDPVTLYNSTLLQWQEDPQSAIEKLEHLMANPPFPGPTVETLLYLCCQPEIGLIDRAAEILSNHPDLVQQYVRAETLEYIEAMILRDSSPEEYLTRLGALNDRQWAQTQRFWRTAIEEKSSREAQQLYKNSVDSNIPVLMTIGHLHYERGHYSAVEHLFLQTSALCSEHLVWRTNVAHTFFVQEKYEDAIGYYADIVKHYDGYLLDVTPVILANLCVSYIVTNQTTLAEDIMRQVEEQEAEADAEDAQQHLCIINLVIGTLYCAKGNFDFGISRVIKSFEPVESKLEAHTWHYAKICFLSLLRHLSKHMLLMSDERCEEILEFLITVQRHGTDLASGDGQGEGQTIAHEARALKRVFAEWI